MKVSKEITQVKNKSESVIIKVLFNKQMECDTIRITNLKKMFYHELGKFINNLVPFFQVINSSFALK